MDAAFLRFFTRKKKGRFIKPCKVKKFSSLVGYIVD